MSDDSLRRGLIRLAYEQPELRSDLLPLIDKQARVTAGDLSRLLWSHILNDRDFKKRVANWLRSSVKQEDIQVPEGRIEELAHDLLYNVKIDVEPSLDSTMKFLRENFRKGKGSGTDHGYEVGDLLYSSWGYDQTNIDFYQVVGVTKKMILIREIASKIVQRERTSNLVEPVPNRFTGAPLRKRPRGTDRGSVKLTSYSSAAHYDGKQKLWETAAGFGH